MRQRRTNKQRRRNAEIIRARAYAPYHGGCSVPGCKNDLVHGVGTPWCWQHRYRMQTHGHPYHDTITFKMIQPFIKEARLLLHVRAEHQAHEWLIHKQFTSAHMRHTDQRWETPTKKVMGFWWWSSRPRYRGARYNRTRMIQRCTAVMLMYEAGLFPDDQFSKSQSSSGEESLDFLHVQLARAIRFAGEAPTKRFNGHRIDYKGSLGEDRSFISPTTIIRQTVKLGRRDLRLLGKQLHDGLVPLLPL